MRRLAQIALTALAMAAPLAAIAQTPEPAPTPTQTAASEPLTPRPSDASVYIIWPVDGMRVHSPFRVWFGLRNMGVTHAGDATPNMGHHHLLIDVTEPPDPNEPIPADKKHLHFGAGQTETLLDLPRGRHTLQLVLGDARHRSFDPPLASSVVHLWVY